LIAHSCFLQLILCSFLFKLQTKLNKLNRIDKYWCLILECVFLFFDSNDACFGNSHEQVEIIQKYWSKRKTFEFDQAIKHSHFLLPFIEFSSSATWSKTQWIMMNLFFFINKSLTIVVWCMCVCLCLQLNNSNELSVAVQNFDFWYYSCSFCTEFFFSDQFINIF